MIVTLCSRIIRILREVRYGFRSRYREIWKRRNKRRKRTNGRRKKTMKKTKTLIAMTKRTATMKILMKKSKTPTNRQITKAGAENEKKNDEDKNADSDGDDDDEEESMEEKRKRLLRERAEEERRKRAQQEEEQVLRVSVERFVVPEVLFRPKDAGLQSDLVGLSQAIIQSVESCPEPYRPALYRSVYLVGGLALLPNLLERLKRELRSLVPSEYDLDISIASSPIDRAWVGAKSYFEKQNYTKMTVSRQEWEEASKRKAYRKLLIENGGCYK
mmetsp:Transcript_2347/g.4908  ORF Transcript_2347/g.4908 Transcript_2347/m.4908 type:complete len:273 (+) Transcript_2347:103-921(+)